MPEKTRNIVACVPVDPEFRFGITYAPPPGSVIRKCPLCGCRVWIGPRSLNGIEQDGFEFACIKCLLELSLIDDSTTLKPLSED